MYCGECDIDEDEVDEDDDGYVELRFVINREVRQGPGEEKIFSRRRREDDTDTMTTTKTVRVKLTDTLEKVLLSDQLG